MTAFNLWFLLFGNASRHTVDTGTFAGVAYKSIGLSLYVAALTALLIAIWRRVRSTDPALIMDLALGGASVASLIFFLLPTEMHERYAYPFAMFAAVWATQRKTFLVAYLIIALGVAMNIASQLSISITDPIFAAIPEIGRAIALMMIAGAIYASPRLITPSPYSSPMNGYL